MHLDLFISLTVRRWFITKTATRQYFGLVTSQLWCLSQYICARLVISNMCHYK